MLSRPQDHFSKVYEQMAQTSLLQRRLFHWRVLAAEWMTLPRFRSRQIGSLIATGGVLLVGLVDYLAGNEVSWSIVYVLPIALAAWYVGPGSAYALALLSIILAVAGDAAYVTSKWNAYLWNSGIKLAF